MASRKRPRLPARTLYDDLERIARAQHLIEVASLPQFLSRRCERIELHHSIAGLETFGLGVAARLHRGHVGRVAHHLHRPAVVVDRRPHRRDEEGVGVVEVDQRLRDDGVGVSNGARGVDFLASGAEVRFQIDAAIRTVVVPVLQRLLDVLEHLPGAVALRCIEDGWGLCGYGNTRRNYEAEDRAEHGGNGRIRRQAM